MVESGKLPDSFEKLVEVSSPLETLNNFEE